MSERTILVLDSLFDDLHIESSTAGALGWQLARWDGTEAALGHAQIVLHVRTRVTRDLISLMSNCRVIGRFGTGLDTVDADAAASQGIHVVNVRDYCTPEMTMQTLVLAFSLLRGVLAGWNNAAMQGVTWADMAASGRIQPAATALVVGYGAIGSAVAHALRAAGLRVLVVTRHGSARARSEGLEVAGLDDGLRVADLVSLHTALSEHTRGMIDAALLEKFKPDAVLVNTARVDLLNQRAVTDAVVAGRLGALGLDAIVPTESPLAQTLSLPTVLVTPHVGWYSERSATVLRSRTVTNAIEAYPSADIAITSGPTGR